MILIFLSTIIYINGRRELILKRGGGTTVRSQIGIRTRIRGFWPSGVVRRGNVTPRYGLSFYFQEHHFPGENAEVVQRSAERARKAREANAAGTARRGLYCRPATASEESVPVTTRCQGGLGPDVTKYYPLLRPAINNALSRLRSVVRPRNELGQFV